jgi:hypothetical protein
MLTAQRIASIPAGPWPPPFSVLLCTGQPCDLYLRECEELGSFVSGNAEDRLTHARHLACFGVGLVRRLPTGGLDEAPKEIAISCKTSVYALQHSQHAFK